MASSFLCIIINIMFKLISRRRKLSQGGFVLPTVVVSFMLMLILMLGALQLASASAAALKAQYYNQLAKEAAESGAARAAECVRLGTIKDNKDITPSSNCSGDLIAGSDRYIMSLGNARMTFSARGRSASSAASVNSRTTSPFRRWVAWANISTSIHNVRSNTVSATGIVELVNKRGVVYKTYKYELKKQFSHELDVSGSRASKRWWYLGGYAKLDFGVSGNNDPKAIEDIRSTTSGEGMTVVSTRSGEVMFFSDGLNVWDKNSQVVPVLPGSENRHPNCDAESNQQLDFSKNPIQRLCGSKTATQAAVSFPINKEETKYIIVHNTANSYKERNFGTLYWSMIDFSNPAYPNGVITKRNMAVRDPALKQYAGEALNARPNAAGNGVVLYTYRPSGPNEVYAIGLWSEDDGVTIKSGETHPAEVEKARYTITSNVLSNCIVDWVSGVDPYKHPGYGSANFDSSYSRIVIYMGGRDCSRKGQPRKKRSGEIHVFDISKGDNHLVNDGSWSVWSNENDNDYGSGYSADFSPNGKYVYATTLYSGRLFRYDISSKNDNIIKNSERFIGMTNCASFPGPGPKNTRCIQGAHSSQGGGQVLRGPNGKMYVADYGANHISVINNPDAPNGPDGPRTAANIGWQYGGLKLPPGQVGYYGLPQMVSLYTPRSIQY